MLQVTISLSTTSLINARRQHQISSVRTQINNTRQVGRQARRVLAHRILFRQAPRALNQAPSTDRTNRTTGNTLTLRQRFLRRPSLHTHHPGHHRANFSHNDRTYFQLHGIIIKIRRRFFVTILAPMGMRAPIEHRRCVLSLRTARLLRNLFIRVPTTLTQIVTRSQQTNTRTMRPCQPTFTDNINFCHQRRHNNIAITPSRLNH